MNKRNKTIENIYRYESFLTFFRDWVCEEQDRSPTLSIGKLAKIMQLSHTASISNILKGRRVPKEQTVEKFKALVELTSTESRYLDLICEKDRQKDNKLVRNALDLSIGQLLSTQNISISRV